MEGSKSIAGDKSIKTKQEKDRYSQINLDIGCCFKPKLHNFRRIKELNENNLKRFMDERRTERMKHEKQEEALRKQHSDQRELLDRECKKVNSSQKKWANYNC